MNDHMTERPLCQYSLHKVNNNLKTKYRMLLACSPSFAHQKNTLVQMVEILSKKFKLTHFHIYETIRNKGKYNTQKKIFSLIQDFDIFLIQFSKPGFDFNFYKKLKQKNPKLIIVFLEGDSEILFPNYSQWLIKDFDFFVSYDNLDVTDVVSQLGCKSFCIGNLISQKDFFHIKHLKKKYDVMFYGGIKYNNSDRDQILSYLREKVNLKCFGKSFGYLSGEELNRKINQSKIVISLNKIGYNPKTIIYPKNYKFGTNLKSKIFEPILCKTFVLSEEVENIDRFYKPNDELVSFKNKTDLLKKINFYLSNSKIREDIAQNALKKTLKYFEAKKQFNRMANIIIKITNERHGLVEKYDYLNGKYKIKKISEKGNYKLTRSHYVNWNAQNIHQLLRKSKLREAFFDLNFLIYGFPFLYIKNQIINFIVGSLVKLRDFNKKN